jgi:hypothetical protein
LQIDCPKSFPGTLVEPIEQLSSFIYSAMARAGGREKG